MARKSAFYYLYWAVLLAAAVVGLWALGVRTTQGLRVTNLGSIIPWGLWVAFYIYFIGLSAGSFLLSTLVYVFGVKKYERVGKTAVFTAFVSLVAGLLFVLIDIGHMERFWTVFFRRNLRSVLEWEIHFYLVYIVILLAELWLLMRTDLIRRAQEPGLVGQVSRLLTLGSSDLSPLSVVRDRRWVTFLGALGIPVAIAVHGGTGAIFAVVKARPYWHTGLFPVIFLVSAMASGGALLAFIEAVLGGNSSDKEHRTVVTSLGRLVAGILALDVLLLASEFLVGLYGEIPEHIAGFQTIMAGPFWWVFWIVQLGFGVLVPFLILLFRRTRDSAGWVGLASLLIVIGIFGVRLNIVIPALSIPVIPGIESAISSVRISDYYYPTAVEWLSSIGVVAICMIIFTLGAELLPLREKLGRPHERGAGLVAGRSERPLPGTSQN
ncbi:MAG: polysulfide reductase NrfD [Firmicutes bacterium]|nr:polysulfide reductase NrfD [Bacillota bacterium]